MKIDVKKYIPIIVAVVISLGILLISAGIYKKTNYGSKYVFIFPCVDDGKYVLETRYLKENPNKTQLHYFVDELVLGSGLERTKYLFTPGTKVNSCIERNKTVYIDLSADIIYMGHNVVQIKDGIELLKQNIMRNFTNIEKVQVFVDGKYAFE